MSTTLGAETAIFTLTRKYLLRTIYLNLKNLSSSTSPALTTNGSQCNVDNIELEVLPPPSTHTPKSVRFYDDATYLHTTISRTIFSWCFAESCMMFGLLMLQGSGIFSPSSRLLNWRISLFILMSAILIVIPLSVSLLLAIGSSEGLSRKSLVGIRIMLCLLVVGLYLFLLSYIPIPPSLETSDTATASLSRLIVLGTIILGLLSGFGAISSLWKFGFVRSNAVPSERDIDAAQYALTSVRNDMGQRRAEAARREGSTSEASWFARVGSSFRGSDSIGQELQGLEALEYQMSRNLEALRERYEAAKFGRTFKGRVFNLIGRVFAVYCVIRVFSSIYNVIFLPTHRSSPSTTYPDLITDILAYLLSLLYRESDHISNDDLTSFARQISLVLVGVIILSSIRLVLRGATRALRITSRNLAASLMLLALAQIMGIYMLSTIVQLRSSFPPPPSPPSDDDDATPASQNLFSTIPAYEVFGSLFDWSFLLASGVSAFVRWGAERVNGTGSDD